MQRGETWAGCAEEQRRKRRKKRFAGREAGAKERKGKRLFSESAEEREGTRLGGKRWVAEGLHSHAPGRDVRREDLRRGERFAVTAEGRERERFCRESRGNSEESFFFLMGNAREEGERFYQDALGGGEAFVQGAEWRATGCVRRC